MEKSRIQLPIVEGQCPPVCEIDEEGPYWYYPEPDPDYEDPEITEEEYYTVEDKEEFYGYVTRCKKCGTAFQAYNDNWDSIRNYCPGCGKELVTK